MRPSYGTVGDLEYEVFCGDCLDELPQFEEETFPLIICDPPFNIGYEYDKYMDEQPQTEYLAWCERWLLELYRLLTPTGTFWLCIGDEQVSELDVLAKLLGFHKRSHVLWYYTFGVACSKNFARSHTHLLYYTKHKTKFTFNAQSKQLRVPSARQLVYHDVRANKAGKLPDNTWVLSPLDLSKAFTESEDTWLESRICGTFKERGSAANQMPLTVMRRMIEATSLPGDWVLDPMAGSFAAGVAALERGRNFTGIELSEQYVAAGLERLRSLKPGSA